MLRPTAGIFIIPLLFIGFVFGQIPKSHSNLAYSPEGLVLTYQGEPYYPPSVNPYFTIQQALGKVKGNKTGLSFDFLSPDLSGTLYYGFIPEGDSKHPHPVYFRRSSVIEEGKAEIPITGSLEGRFDMVGWKEKGYGTLGYRIVSNKGEILYDGKVTFTGEGPFEVAPSFVEGPFVNLLSQEGAVISYSTKGKVASKVRVLKGEEIVGEFGDKKKKTSHEVQLSGLNPQTTYDYEVEVGPVVQKFSFQTAPAPGSRSAFTFAYASDSRNGQGGGERNVYGANFYIMKKIMALARFSNASFFQFSGDLINGYLTSKDEMSLQYANWKRAVEPFAHYFPIYVSMGNHEALMQVFVQEGKRTTFLMDRFPYETESGEAAFAKEFVMPTNGPESEDGAEYDPSEKSMDFPSYKENVFYYTYDNVAVVVLNSDYWYAPSSRTIPITGGGLHGYIMDQQLKWFDETIAKLEADANIDHIFLTQHTPFFPNGGHVGDDMWYNGNNQMRPFVAGKALANGIIQRRDQLLEIIVNKSQKVRAILTGDEHNYAKTKIGPDTPIYPETYPSNLKVKLNRTIMQINNGAAGAPYYAQEQTPWSDFVSGFTTQNALVLFTVEGEKISVKVMNPDTLEEIESFDLTE